MHSEQFVVAGLNVNVFSLVDLASSSRPVVALFFLHGRRGSALKIQRYIQVILEQTRGYDKRSDLMVITFDHRNHGVRCRDAKANEGWSKHQDQANNDRHALDMYAIQCGTTEDVSFLIDFLPAYIFPEDNRRVCAWGVAGKSLGGHSTWLALANDDRIVFGAPIIACPDYLKLMKERAEGHGIKFTPPYFPTRLVEVVARRDPVTKPYDQRDATNPFLGKKILVMSGANDKKVPWKASEEFVEKLEVGLDGKKITIVYAGIGHECTTEMQQQLGKFVADEYLRK